MGEVLTHQMANPRGLRPQDVAAGSRTPAGHDRRIAIAILGANLDNRNLGVGALAMSAIKGTLMALPNARIMILDHSARSSVTVKMLDRTITVESIWLRLGNSVRDRYDTKYLTMARSLEQWLPATWARCLIGDNRTLKQLREIDVVLDVSAGDSFTDLYGWKEFRKQVTAKNFMIRAGKPVILLPQTYGPFDSARARRMASQIISSCRFVATREENGVEEIKELCGSQLSGRVARCPDMAFLMDPNPSAVAGEPFIRRRREEDQRLIGMNISGLLYLSKANLGLQSRYRRVVDKVATWALADPRARLLLVPHVIAGEPLSDDPEQWPAFAGRDINDTAACKIVMKTLHGRYGERVGCLGWPYTADETKYFIGCCDFFIGARMHSCIGAISQAVPTATLAYSKKAIGLMEQLGIGDTVIDLRSVDGDEVVSKIEHLYRSRRKIRRTLKEKVPAIKADIEAFFTRDLRDAVLSVCGRKSSEEQRVGRAPSLCLGERS